MAQKPPTVEVVGSGREVWTELALPAGLGGCIRLDTAAWFAWLETPSAVSFAYPIVDAAAGWIAGYMTIRKERRGRGSHYWVAYRRGTGGLRKAYLGRSVQVTQAHLAAVAAQWGAPSK
jgi:hypothetical protein